jgi:tetratricopeptide (TPR) repeat protein
MPVKRPSIIGIALAAGVFAFVYTLHTQAPQEQRRPSQIGGHGRAMQSHVAAGPLGREMISGAPVSLEQAEQFAKVNEHDWRAWVLLAQRREWAGCSDAREAWEHLLRLAYAGQPGQNPGLLYAAALAHTALGHHPEARRAYEQLATVYRERSRGDGLRYRQSWYRFGRAAAYLGDEEEARTAWERASNIAALEGDESGLAQFDLACYRSLLGDQEGGVEALLLAAEAGFADATVVEHEEDLALVRKHPKFADAIARVQENAKRSPGTHAWH